MAAAERAGPPIPCRRPVVSGRTALRLVEAGDGEVEVSLDLGLSRARVRVEGRRLVLPDGTETQRPALRAEFSDPEDCILLWPEGPEKVYLFDGVQRKYYKLYQPFEGRAPTIVINGATMHAIIGTDPWQDAQKKVAGLPRAGGKCLDTCCGLGYSAQLLAEAGHASVTTCEVDGNVLRVAAMNPWSARLFQRGRITILSADVRDVLAEAGEGEFSCIFHDPPTVYQAGELYSGDLYSRFAAALRPGGAIYHYVGAPGERLGRDYARGVIRRLQAAGFTGVRRVYGGVLGRRAR